MSMDFIEMKTKQIEEEIVSVLVKWTLADRVECNPSSHRKMRVKAREDKELLNFELRNLKLRLDHLEK